MSSSEKELEGVRMLGLKLPTDPRWVNLAEMDLGEILTDHAYCEQKAATFCISIIQSYPEHIEMVKALAPIVTEEWGHFRSVLRELEKRNLPLGRQRKDQYVNQLMAFQKTHIHREEKLLEKLLCCALIEARSCERFRLLSLHINDDELKEFYHWFMVSEAGHYHLFIELARKYFGEEKTNKRWQEYLDHEIEILNNLDLRGDRIH